MHIIAHRLSRRRGARDPREVGLNARPSWFRDMEFKKTIHG